MPFAPEATLSLSIRLKLQRGESFSVLMHTAADEASPFFGGKIITQILGCSLRLYWDLEVKLLS